MSVEVFLDAYGEMSLVGELHRHSGSRHERVTYKHDPDWLSSPLPLNIQSRTKTC